MPKDVSIHSQRGNGEYIPQVLLRKGQDKAQLSSGLAIEFVQYLPSMHAYMEAADLIISHAGSGSLFEALSLSKTIIAVPNAILMANHQVTSWLGPLSLLLRPQHLGSLCVSRTVSALIGCPELGLWQCLTGQESGWIFCMGKLHMLI